MFTRLRLGCASWPRAAFAARRAPGSTSVAQRQHAGLRAGGDTVQTQLQAITRTQTLLESTAPHQSGRAALAATAGRQGQIDVAAAVAQAQPTDQARPYRKREAQRLTRADRRGEGELEASLLIEAAAAAKARSHDLLRQRGCAGQQPAAGDC
ncbi:MAG: hypothetical protein ACOVKS_01750 [Aquimonas sp.]